MGLVGATVIGRLSDDPRLGGEGGGNGRGGGRRVCLYIGSFAALASAVLALVLDDRRGLYWSMIPAALLQQNFSVWKAVLADYAEGLDDDDKSTTTGSVATGSSASAARAASVGKLGMSAGLAFMVGPFIGSVIVDTYEKASYIAIGFVVLSTFLITRMPPSLPPKKTTTSTAPLSSSLSPKKKSSLLDLTSTMLTPTSLFLIVIRVNMALAFNIFNTIWTASLKSRFNFTPRDHGTFMSFIGLVYALSQGYLSPRILALLTTTNKVTPPQQQHQKVGKGSDDHRGRIRILQLACITLGIGRAVAFHLKDIRFVYAVFFLIVVSLGLVNTVLTVDAGRCVPPSEIGGLYGILAAAESAAGMVGPVIGGGLVRLGWGENGVGAPLGTVVGLYGLLWVMITLGYERLVLGMGTMITAETKTVDGSVGNDGGVVVDQQKRADIVENKKDV